MSWLEEWFRWNSNWALPVLDTFMSCFYHCLQTKILSGHQHNCSFPSLISLYIYPRIFCTGRASAHCFMICAPLWISASSEGANLGLFTFDSLKSPKKRKLKVNLGLYKNTDVDAKGHWEDGTILADSQNFARTLMETPANLMTPKIFTDAVSKQLSESVENLEIYSRYVLWDVASPHHYFICELFYCWRMGWTPIWKGWRCQLWTLFQPLSDTQMGVVQAVFETLKHAKK